MANSNSYTGEHSYGYWYDNDHFIIFLHIIVHYINSTILFKEYGHFLMLHLICEKIHDLN